MLPVDAAPVNETTDWTPELNHRRCDLIDKKFATGLTPAEEQELATLTAGLRRFVERATLNGARPATPPRTAGKGRSR
jgi:hypothetical protein